MTKEDAMGLLSFLENIGPYQPLSAHAWREASHYMNLLEKHFEIKPEDWHIESGDSIIITEEEF